MAAWWAALTAAEISPSRLSPTTTGWIIHGDALELPS
jgi:hypothetical protein